MEVLDTDILIDVQRGHPPALAWLGSMTKLPAVPGFVVMELIQDARNRNEVRLALKLTAPFQIVWPSETDCMRALYDFAMLHPSHNLGLLDSLIAACATGLSAKLLTFNDKHFRAVPDLQTAHPYVR